MVVGLLCTAPSMCRAGRAAQGQSAEQQNAPGTAAQDSAGQSRQGTVIFSRSAGSASGPEHVGNERGADERAPASLAASVTDAMRLQLSTERYDFTIHLQPASAAMEVQLQMVVRNNGPAFLSVLPLQLSSTLHFEHVRTEGKPLRFAVHVVPSDADHTGALEEAAIQLPVALPPGAKQSFTIEYAGAIPPSSARLDRLGAPAATAAQTDWDRISESFTGLRGFGNVVWYPVASVPSALGDGNKLFREIGRQKERNAGATVSMDLTLEFGGQSGADAPTIAVLDGIAIAPGEPASLPTESFPGVLHLPLPPTVLGFATPSLVLAARSSAAAGALVTVAALPGQEPAAEDEAAAARLLEPLYQDWFQQAPARPLLLLGLPLAGAAPAQDGGALLLSLLPGSSASLADALSGPLSYAYFHSPRAWLQEGVAGLFRLLWIERTEGHAKALEELGADRGSLAIVEPASPGQTETGQPGESPAREAGEPLLHATDAVYFRTKATSVLYMLRSLAGDEALAAALRAYHPGEDTTDTYFQKLLETSMAAHPQRVASGDGTGKSPAAQADAPSDSADRSLDWFFRAWVYDDPGLPDLLIRNVFPSRSGGGDQWLCAVDISNAGYAEAQVPVTVRSGSATVTEQVRVPARGSLSRRILIAGEPTEVDVNDGSVPEVQASVHRRLLQ